jgi:hypothetical protein
MPPFFMGEVRAMEWFYMAASFGEGQSLDTTYVLPYKEDGYLAHFFEFAGAANHDAFRRVPVQAIGAAVGNFDIASAIYWIVDELVAAEELDPDEFEMGLQEMQDTLGIHIMEDFINYMTGDVLQITFPVDDIEDEMQGLLAYSYGLMVMDVQAMEDVQRALSGLMLAAAEAVEVEESEVLWGKLWQLDLMGMFGIEVGTFPGSMFVSFHPAAVQQFQAHANSGSDTPNFYTLPGVQKVLGELEGSYTYLFQTSELFDSVANLMGDMALMEEDEELDFLTDLLQDASEIAADHLDGWVGSTVSFDGRIRVQSIAR